MQHYNFSKCHKTILCVQVTSARWQNRKSQASFPSRKSNLRTIYGPKHLYNNSMNQSESCSTLGKLKAQNKCLKRGGKINFIATMSVPPSTWHYSPMGGKSLLAAFPLQGRENSGTSISAMTFQGAAHGSGFCPTRCRALMRNQNTLGCLGAAENKKEFSSCGNTREPVILQKETDTALCIQEKVPSLWLLPASNILALGRAAWGTGLCLRWLRALTDMANFEYLGGTENTPELKWVLAVPKNLQCHGQTPEGSRDKKVLKKKQANLSHWKNTCTSPEITHFQKSFERLPKSLAWLTDEVLSLYDANL